MPQLRYSASEIRWAPDARRLGLLVGIPARLYLFRADGSFSEQVHFADPDMTVDQFAWSPSGKQILFRSSYHGFQCTGMISFKDQEVHDIAPCRAGSGLFSADSDGSNIRAVSKATDFKMGASQLFWIQ